ncbi:MAG: glycosyltransferase family 9 protein [Candidatus Caenarcaniphilales bacterium]|nr:glycosyltransferase family 9 protein [Candidatus Caenarcaniphilales bacterium]
MSLSIVLPRRIGDSIQCLPALSVLARLHGKTKDHHFEKIRLYLKPDLKDLFDLLTPFEIHSSNLWEKLKAHLTERPDRVVFLDSSSAIIGFPQIESIGERLPRRFYARFQSDLPVMDLCRTRDSLPVSLYEHLRSYGLGDATIRYFGFLVVLGFDSELLIHTLNETYPCLKGLYSKIVKRPFIEAPHITLNMEADYSKPRSDARRWSPENFFSFAQWVYQNYQLETVLIGLDQRINIQESSLNFIHEARGKRPLKEVAEIIAGSEIFLGNDSGLLHLANLLQKPTLGIYTATDPDITAPIFPDLNHPLKKPEGFEDLIILFERMMRP